MRRSIHRTPKTNHSCMILGLALCAVIAGCVPDPPSGQFPALETDASVSPDTDYNAPESIDGPMRPDGTWLYWSETASCVNALNTRLANLSWGLNLAHPVVLSNGKVSWVVHGCHYSQAPMFRVDTIIPDKFAETSPDRVLNMSTDSPVKGGVYPPGTRVKIAKFVELWGAHLGDPLNDPMPTTPDDPRVWDMDRDGNPGGTIWAQGPDGKKLCTIWIAHRSIVQLDLTVKNAIMLEGGGHTTSEQHYLYASGGICAVHAKVDFMDGHQRFVFLRIDGKYGAPDLDLNHDGEISCDELRKADLTPWIRPNKPDDAVCKEDSAK